MSRLLCLSVCVCLSLSLSASFVFDAQVSPRLQWLHNDGYCGEVSLIMAGLKHGQYFSQYDIRAIAGKSQQNEYLVGVNDEKTAEAVRLGHVEYDNEADRGDADAYLAWVKAMTRKGHTVTICVFMNYYLFYGSTNPSAGDGEYDHIVTVSRVESAFDDDLYHDEDVLVIEDHGLWAPRTTGAVYLFNYTFRDVKASREEANARSNANIYSVPSAKKMLNYGIAHIGPVDEDQSLLPVRLSTSVNYEDPEIDNRSEVRPDAMPLQLTVTVEGLVSGREYTLYRYDSETDVPTRSFNANAANASSKLQITGTATGTYESTISIMSSNKVIFRAVESSSP